MDPTLEFLKSAAKTEFTTPGGWINFTVVGVLALAVGGAESAGFLMQVLEFAYRVLDRILHFFEKFFELIARIARTTFEPSPKPDPYKAPHEPAKRAVALVFLGVLGIGCCVAVGGARYQAQAAPNNRNAGYQPASPKGR